MKSAVETLEPTKIKLTVEVAAQDLKPALDQAYKEISGQISVPGFRPGKVPARIIDQRVGRGVVIEQAMSDSLDDWYRAALDEHKLQPMAGPEVDISRKPDPAASEPDFEFTATVEVRPEIAIPDLSLIKVTVASVDVTDERVDGLVDGLRERFASLKGVDRPAQDGDFVTIDLKAEIDGEEIDSVAGISYQIGSGEMLEGIDEALDGLSAEETTTFKSPLAGGGRAGEEALVTVKLTAVRERELPPADDDFAELASEFDTIEELRQEMARSAALLAERDQVIEAQDKLIDHLLATLDFPAPPGVVQADAEARLERDGKPADDAEAAAEYQADSIKAIRTQLLVDALVQHLGVTAAPQELVGFVGQTAEAYGIDPATFVNTAAQSGELPHFYAELLRNKASVEALRQITVEDADGAAVDIRSRLAPAAPESGPLDDAVDQALAERDGDTAADQDALAAGLAAEIGIDLEALAEADQEGS
ncbi:MAG: trigger factor [Bifidobacteriaceae bacterium]|nr:trigger factor [Bifidobacteriaceae bacterium]